MSYSFEVKGANKQIAAALAAVEMAKVVASQPAHQADETHARGCIGTMVECLDQDPTKDVQINVNGSVYVVEDGKQSSGVRQVEVRVVCRLVDRAAAA